MESLALRTLLRMDDKDVVGRRPVIFGGPIGIAVTTMAFGFSTSFSGIVASRFFGQFSFRSSVVVMFTFRQS